MTQQPIILKFGSSVLRSPDDLPRAATEVYRYVRQAQPVIAVVSAFEGETDRLIAQATAYGLCPDKPSFARHVALGEQSSAEALQARLDEIGLSATILSPTAMSLTALGPPDAAVPVSVDKKAVQSALDHSQVVIVPGFAALNAQGAPVLLGRGGSDLTAIFLASCFHRVSARLIKDVDGLYTSDPNIDEQALRFSEIDWATACEIAGVLIQPQAVTFAKARKIEIEIARIGQCRCTKIGKMSLPPRPGPERRPLRVAVFGDCALGHTITERIRAEPDRYELAAVFRSLTDQHQDTPQSGQSVTRAFDLHRARPDVLIETRHEKNHIATETLQYLTDAIVKGVSVITANKRTIARNLGPLQDLATEMGTQIYYGSSVGVAAPILEAVQAVKNPSAIVKIEGVLNIRMNFIMREMSRGATFADAIIAAQDAGGIDFDPNVEFCGYGALAKAQIIARHAFPGRTVRTQACQSIRDSVEAQRYCKSGQVKQLMTIIPEGGSVTLSVVMKGQTLRDKVSFVTGKKCGAVIHYETGETQFVRADATERISTVEHILGDLGDIERNLTERGHLNCPISVSKNSADLYIT